MKKHTLRNGSNHFFFTWLFFLAAMASIPGCASTSVDRHPASSDRSANPRIVYTPEAKPVTAVLPLTLGLAPEAVKRYPHLVKKNLGMGIYQVVLSAVTESNRFRVVEIRPANIDAILMERWLRQSGLMSEKEATVAARQPGAVQVIYGRVYDYAETLSEEIVGLKVRREVKTMVGVQLICTDVSSRRQIGIGTAVGYGDDILSATRTAVSLATDKMIARIFANDPDDARPSNPD